MLALTPLDLHIDPCEFRVGGAVAGSASFPLLVGPFTLRVGEEELYWHTGDGGLYENSGIESLLFVFLKKLQEKKARRAEPFTLFTYDYSCIPGIMEQRAGAYAALFFRSPQLEGASPDNDTVRDVSHSRGLVSRTSTAFRRESGQFPTGAMEVATMCAAETYAEHFAAMG
jgi:hypothetical protein